MAFITAGGDEYVGLKIVDDFAKSTMSVIDFTEISRGYFP